MNLNFYVHMPLGLLVGKWSFSPFFWLSKLGTCKWAYDKNISRLKFLLYMLVISSYLNCNTSYFRIARTIKDNIGPHSARRHPFFDIPTGYSKDIPGIPLPVEYTHKRRIHLEGHNLNGGRGSSVFFNNSTPRTIRYRFDPFEVRVMVSLPIALWPFVTIVRVCSNTHALCLFNNGFFPASFYY